MKSLIIGMGQIGEGLFKILGAHYDLDTWDLTYPDPLKFDKDWVVLNICIPGSIPDFEKVVAKYIMKVKPKLTIIHSTVPIGTTRIIEETTKTNVVHSPVRGKHPNLADGIGTYVKYIGYNNWKAQFIAEAYFKGASIPCQSMEKTESTELAKILSTTRYGLNLMFTELQYRLCALFSVDFEQVYTDWELTYNEGLGKSGFPEYKRPVLKPPGSNIGGHCVVENAYMLLNQMYPDHESDTILASLLTQIIAIGKGDRILDGFDDFEGELEEEEEIELDFGLLDGEGIND